MKPINDLLIVVTGLVLVVSIVMMMGNIIGFIFGVFLSVLIPVIVLAAIVYAAKAIWWWVNEDFSTKDSIQTSVPKSGKANKSA